MPGKGKSKSKGKGSSVPKEQRVLMLKDDDHNYGTVMKKLGGGRFAIRLNLRSTEIIGRLCGKFKHGANKKRNWVDVGTVVLVGLREFQDNVVDIVHIYEAGEVRQLRKMGELIEDAEKLDDDVDVVVDDETGFDFNDI